MKQAIYRGRLLSAAWAVLGLISWFTLAVLSAPDLSPLFHVSFPLAIALTHSLMIVPPVLLMLFSGSRLTLRSARIRSFWSVAALLAGAGLMQGRSHFDPTLAGFGFAYLGVSVTSALMTGFPLPAENAIARLSSLTTAVCLGVLGVAMNRWFQRNHRRIALAQLRLVRRTSDAERERRGANQLLERALTPSVARELRAHGSYASTTTEVCVIECDVVGFSAHCEKLPVKVVVNELRRFGKVFDDCCFARHVEPLKSWGDSRIAVAGLTAGSLDEPRIPEVDAVLAMLDFRSRFSFANGGDPSVWPAQTGRILVSEKLLFAARGLFDHGAIWEIQVKKTIVNAAELIGIRSEYRDDLGGPNPKFWDVYRQTEYATSYPDPHGTEKSLCAAGHSNVS